MNIPLPRIRPAIAIFAVIFLLAGNLLSDPAWWSDPATKIWETDPQNTENHAPINVGQLKHVTTQAEKYLETKLSPVGAGPEIKALPPFTQDDNFAPANVGQLKFLAEKFYNHLHAIGFDVKPGLVANGFPQAPLDAQTGGPIYPWDLSSPASENDAPANIGQLKMAFSFEFDTYIQLDNDSNGIPDWKQSYVAQLPEALDTDGDGLTDAYEILTDRDPYFDEETELASAPTGPTGLEVFTPVLANLESASQ